MMIWKRRRNCSLCATDSAQRDQETTRNSTSIRPCPAHTHTHAARTCLICAQSPGSETAQQSALCSACKYRCRRHILFPVGLPLNWRYLCTLPSPPKKIVQSKITNATRNYIESVIFSFLRKMALETFFTCTNMHAACKHRPMETLASVIKWWLPRWAQLFLLADVKLR